MPIFMKYPDITGKSTLAGFEDMIELNSLQWGVGRAIDNSRGIDTREGGICSVSEITATKMLDSTSPKLFIEACTGELDNEVEIHFVRTASGETQMYCKYVLTNTGISGFSTSSGGDRPTESLSLNFTKIEYTYSPVGNDLTGDPLTVNYDLGTGKSG